VNCSKIPLTTVNIKTTSYGHSVSIQHQMDVGSTPMMSIWCHFDCTMFIFITVCMEHSSLPVYLCNSLNLCSQCDTGLESVGGTHLLICILIKGQNDQIWLPYHENNPCDWRDFSFSDVLYIYNICDTSVCYDLGILECFINNENVFLNLLFIFVSLIPYSNIFLITVLCQRSLKF